MKKTVGVLALQGAFAKHIEMLRSIGADAVEVRKPGQLQDCDGLIIPGGESTTLFKRIDFISMKQPLIDFAASKPVFGTCAGLILMSKTIRNSQVQPFGFMDLEVERNGFGRQRESFTSLVNVHKPLKSKVSLKGVFIRAPRIVSYHADIKVLVTYLDEPVVVQQGRFLAATCHPELTLNTSIHQHFLQML